MIRDVQTAEAVSEILMLLRNAGKEFWGFAAAGKESDFDSAAQDIQETLLAIYNVSADFRKEEVHIRLNDTCRCAAFSLGNILDLYGNNRDKCLMKIEFELCPLLEIMYYQFRYWGCAYPDRHKIEGFVNNELQGMCLNKYIEEAEKKGKYGYDLSICVTAYNKLEYTMACVESIRKHLPEEITYELILFNHGSTDATKQYFDSIQNAKQIDVLINGAAPCMKSYFMEGEYILYVSNDIVITAGAIDNLVRCIKSCPNAGWVVPTTPNVSNFQNIHTDDYSSMEQMHSFAEQNNIYDEGRHERRTRLVNPVTLIKNELNAEINKQRYLELSCADGEGTFPDDRCSLWFRRNGYELILAKDAFCHHFGSVTFKDEITKGKYDRGIKGFYADYGYNPWGTGMCYDFEFVELLDIPADTEINVLSINCGLGSNPLKIREVCREEGIDCKVNIFSLINNKSYIPDLQFMSSEVQYFERYAEVKEYFQKRKIHIIVWEELTGTKEEREIIEFFRHSVQHGGPELQGIYLSVESDTARAALVEMLGSESCLVKGKWMLISMR